MRLILIAAVLLASPASTVSLAHARDSGQTAIDACMHAVSDEVRFEQPGATRIGSDNPKVKQVSNTEDSVGGAGQFNDSKGNTTGFSYRCTYNVKTGRTYGIDIRVQDTPPPKISKTDVGVAVGALVVGAIIDSIGKKKKHKKQDGGGASAQAGSDTWSPADGVLCDASQSVCYKDGKFSAKWTDKVFN